MKQQSILIRRQPLSTIEYTRVSTDKQNLDRQSAAPVERGADGMFLEKVSCVRAVRPQLRRMLTSCGRTIPGWWSSCGRRAWNRSRSKIRSTRRNGAARALDVRGPSSPSDGLWCTTHHSKVGKRMFSSKAQKISSQSLLCFLVSKRMFSRQCNFRSSFGVQHSQMPSTHQFHNLLCFIVVRAHLLCCRTLQYVTFSSGLMLPPAVRRGHTAG